MDIGEDMATQQYLSIIHHRFRILRWSNLLNLSLFLVLTLAMGANQSYAAGDHVVEEDEFAAYDTAHTVIKCPYLPEGLKEAPRCDGKSVTCLGTNEHDLILGSEDDDVIAAGPGNDAVHGDAGSDVICGGPGNDALFGARGDDIIHGGPGDDWLFGAPGADRLHGGPGHFDFLFEGPGYGYVNGGPGDFDVCLLQREMAEVSKKGCETIFPPPGYVHDEDPDPGVVKAANPLKLKKK